MKKLIFLFTMVLAVSMANAQQTTWVTQTGNSNLANITQEACTSGLPSSIYAVQSGDWNTINAMQTGMTNYIELKQTGDRNTANMTQSTCEINGPGGRNTADVFQRGDANTANLVQKEANVGGWEFSVNVANAVQSGNYNNYNLEQGRVHMSRPVPYIPNNKSYLTQSGDRNNAGIAQAGQYDNSEIRQSGDWNTANLHQRGINPDDGETSVLYSYTRSDSWQTGARNMLNILQDNTPNHELVNSVQNGAANTTNVTQIGVNLQEVISLQHGTADVINVLQKNL